MVAVRPSSPGVKMERRTVSLEAKIGGRGVGEWMKRSLNVWLPFATLRLMLKLKLQYFGHLMQIPDSFEKTLMHGITKSCIQLSD